MPLDTITLRLLDKQTEREVHPRLRLPNNRPGADQLIVTLSTFLTEQGYTQLELGWEATGLLWLPLYFYLAQSEALQPFQPRFVCFNPKLVRDFKQGITLQPDKTDPSDAFAIAWSYHLLPPTEQTLFRQLSCFAGTWSLEACEAVCQTEGMPDHFLDHFRLLIDNSLVTVSSTDSEARYRMLDTIREFAADQLVLAGKTDAVCQRHADFYVEFAQRAELVP